MARTLATVTVAVLAATPARGDEPAPSERDGNEEDRAAHDDSSPLPSRSKLRVEPAYVARGSDAYTIEVKVQPTLRYAGFVVPGLEVPGFVSFARLQTYVRSMVDPARGTDATGLTDLLFIDGAAYTFSRRFALGAGYAMTIPMATSPELDKRAWQLGPSFLIASDPIPSLQVNLLTNVYLPLRTPPGASSYVSMTVQPVVTWHFVPGAFVTSDATMTFDLSGSGHSDVPLSAGIGKAFGPDFVGGVQFWYTLAGEKAGDVAVHLKLTFPLERRR